MEKGAERRTRTKEGMESLKKEGKTESKKESKKRKEGGQEG